MNIFLIFLSLSVLCYRQLESAEHVPAGPIGQFIQTNLIGFPLLHESQKWVFDPDVALKRRKDFIAVNGDKAEKLIEKLGLGLDDRREDRLKRQRARDEGHVGGLTWLRED
ncbi:uncharacterized protein LOC120625472 [Pararge aegeria]|uniref:Jg20039 protein n=1 Tax=Pararge aegeria aegeria TaxID=348720 RepID=A0A8S4R4S2_9NEOP|nr:uncharacterized protein LOC120625472 [Pararge aegeria]CAH2230292.1 jg20039 [Pararge aegeria aegeria]